MIDDVDAPTPGPVAEPDPREPTIQRWQPFETAPKDTTIDVWVKVWEPDSDSFGGYRITNVRWTGAYWKDVPHTVRPTHWMPLPEAPK